MASVEIMLRFKEKNRDKKNKKAAFTVAWMKFLLNFQAQKTTQERIIDHCTVSVAILDMGQSRQKLQ